MDEPTRRTLLRGTGLALATGLAGCAGGPLGSAESSAGATPEPKPAGVTFSGSVVRQSSEDDPARVEIAIANEGDAPIELGFKPALFAGFQSRVNDLRLRPVANVGDFPDPSHEDGCWTMPSETVSRVTATEFRTLDPGGEYTERYDLFTIAGAGDCLPDGGYAVTTEAEIRGAQARLSLPLKLSIDGATVAVSEDTGATVA